MTTGSTDAEKERWRALRDRDRRDRARRRIIRKATESQEAFLRQVVRGVLRERKDGGR